jgi:hypothetical protein
MDRLENSLTAAVRDGDFDGVAQAHEDGEPWNEYTFMCAAFRGNMDIVQYLSLNKCPHDIRSYFAAIHNNHAPVIEYLYQNHGSKWVSSITSWACYFGNLAVLRYAHNNGCAIAPQAYIFAANTTHKDNSDEILAYLNSINSSIYYVDYKKEFIDTMIAVGYLQQYGYDINVISYHECVNTAISSRYRRFNAKL